MLAHTELNTLGWIFLLVSTVSMTSLAIWCFKKVLGGSDEPPESHIGLGP